MIESLFNFITIGSASLWLAMIIFPKQGFTQRIVTQYWPYMVLAALYALILLVALSQGLRFSLSLQGFKASLDSSWVLLLVWTHLISFNLFIGVWIFRDASYWRIATRPHLVLCWFLGPVGLGSYLWFRRQKVSKDPIRLLN